FLVVVLASTDGHAQQKGLIDVFGDWSAFAIKEAGQPVCYIGSEPGKQQGDYKKRGDTYMLVTLRPSDKKSSGIVSLTAGYSFKKGRDVIATIGKDAFKMFTKNGSAWTYKDSDDDAMVAAMKRGVELVVKGTSSRGTETTDTYSLKGFTAAHKTALEACK
ncbi:MAG: hypothetical protein HOK06_04325, partial [Rhodospirillaceae bacterium]|nr:hypothetical protein [Rhodospirillaceae bacterium]